MVMLSTREVSRVIGVLVSVQISDRLSRRRPRQALTLQKASGILSVSRHWKLKLLIKHSDHEEAFPHLRNTVVSSVDHSLGDPVTETFGSVENQRQRTFVDLVGQARDILKDEGSRSHGSEDCEVSVDRLLAHRIVQG